MSLGGSSPPESLDASGLPVPDGGSSTSVPAGWSPFKVSSMASNEHSMRASSSNGGGGAGGVGGSRDDAPLPRPLRVLTILYALTCITPKLSGSVLGRFKFVLLKLRNRVRR
jgi:hypothetical protein